jgi:GTP-binding protein HflX
VLIDTVGFIRHLPHELVAAFKSTLQEASEADLLLHVIDASSEDRADTIYQVNQVLEDIEANEIRQLEVFNKVDLLDDIQPRIERDDVGNPVRVWLSAETGAGIDLLYQALVEIFSNTKIKRICRLRPDQGDIRAKLFACAKILSEKNDDLGGCELAVEIDTKYLGLLTSVELEEIL